MNKKICQIGYLKFGIGHYLAHLYPELSPEFDINVATYTHGSPGDRLVMDDDIINQNVKKYIQIIDPHGFQKTTESINSLFNLFNQEKFNLLNLHISSYTRKTAHIYVPLIDFFKTKGLKIVYTFHDVLPTPEGVNPTLFLNFFYNLADWAIVGNENEKNDLLKIFNFNKPVNIATHGVYHLFNRGRFDQKTARQNLKIDQEKKVIIFFGILRDNKGLDDLIEALKRLISFDKNYFLIIAISQRLGFTFDKYQQQINQDSLSSYVLTSLKEEHSIDEIEAFFKASDLLVLPYTSTSQSGILNLGFAFQTPVIISDRFAEKNIVDKKMGFVVSPKNPQQLTTLIRQYFDQKNQLLPLFQKNITQYNQDHSFKQTADVYKNVFNQLLKS